MINQGEPNNINCVNQEKTGVTPAISAIIVIPGIYDNIRSTINHLRAQTIKERIEFIMVVPSINKLILDRSEFNCFHSWKIVEIEAIKSKALGFMAGARTACSQVVAMLEDHSLPDSHWAELLVRAYGSNVAAVGPSMCNGNPEPMLSWADFYLACAEWASPVKSSPVRHLPGHNSSYKKDVLLRYLENAAGLMEVENVLHWHMKKGGYSLYLEAGTCTAHINLVTWSTWITKLYHAGRMAASTWSLNWSRAHKLIYTVASPVIPLVHLWRLQKQILKRHSLFFFIRLLPIMVSGLLPESAGYMIGYAAEAGDSIEKSEKYEYYQTPPV